MCSTHIIMMRKAYKIVVTKLQSKRLHGTPRFRSDDNVNGFQM
jgi:hypothetical protein